MSRRSKQSDPLTVLAELQELLSEFPKKLDKKELRAQVQALVPAYVLLRNLGSSLISKDHPSGRDRILYYLRQYPNTIIHGEDLMVVAGISDWPRRTRELRVQFGWQIATGKTITEMRLSEEADGEDSSLPVMKADDYILLNSELDRTADELESTNVSESRPVSLAT